MTESGQADKYPWLDYEVFPWSDMDRESGERYGWLAAHHR